ncbi:2'-5' RNA ligase family protein [Sinomonas mesophila]|uniref:2'-5' RNA ligase family protein n=1 Tax=Sinomonas mesophila TaxID=1531955 RepID=UPI0009848959|nr:2'-5' RNA ligase family protein [Sinomonas mesophila]
MDPAGPQLHPFVVVAFVEPAPVGERFSKRHWPLHVTLLRFDMAPEAALAAAAGAFASFQPVTVRVGRDADFGYRGRVRVSLVDPHPDLAELHERIRSAVADADGRIHSPQHTGRGFRAHITVQNGRRVAEGEELVLGAMTLVDMAPDGDTEWRLPVAEYPAQPAADADR